MNNSTDFGEIIMFETDDYDKFPRKKLIKTYNKYNDILKAFKTNKFHLGSLGETKTVLTKFELKLIHEEIDNDTYKYTSREEARDALLKHYVKELYDCVNSMKESIDNLPEDNKSTHYECECGSKVLKTNKSTHLKSLLHMNFVNQIPPKLKAETTVACGCGKTFSLKNKTHHNKTQYHLDWLSVNHDLI